MPQQPYKHLFFDLDHTLWDFQANSQETLIELFEEFELGNKCAGGVKAFLNRYYYHNGHCWDMYRKGKMTKQVLRTARFSRVLKEYHIADDVLVNNLSETYIQRCPQKTCLMPHATETLRYLAENNYSLHLLTNGFQETQMIKLQKSGLREFFAEVITADMAGALKPDARIFHYSLNAAGATTKDTIYIGDHMDSDVIGARNAGLDQVYYNPFRETHDEEITFEVHCLSELQEIF